MTSLRFSNTPPDKKLKTFLDDCSKYGLSKTFLIKYAIKRLINDLAMGKVTDDLDFPPEYVGVNDSSKTNPVETETDPRPENEIVWDDKDDTLSSLKF